MKATSRWRAMACICAVFSSNAEGFQYTGAALRSIRIHKNNIACRLDGSVSSVNAAVHAQDHRKLWASAGLDARLAQVHDDVLPADLLKACAAEAVLFDEVAGDESYFYAFGANDHAERAPRFAIEAALHLLYAVAIGDGGAVDGIIGGEWWVQNRELSDSIEMHFDKDEGLLASDNIYSFPPLSTVTYLRNQGAPTLILNQTLPCGDALPPGQRAWPLLPSNGFISYPKTSRHLVFRGNTQHGVAAKLAPPSQDTAQSSQRLTLLVNWWTRKPNAPNCLHVTDELAKAAKVLDASGAPSCIGAQALADKLASISRAPARSTILQADVAPEVPVHGANTGGDAEVCSISMDDAVKERMRLKVLVAGEDILWLDLPLGLAPGRCYEVSWDENSVFGNLCRLLPQHIKQAGRGSLISSLQQDSESAKVIVFVSKDKERQTLAWLRPLASALARRVSGASGSWSSAEGDAGGFACPPKTRVHVRFVIARPSGLRKILQAFAGPHSSSVDLECADATALWVAPALWYEQSEGGAVAQADRQASKNAIRIFSGVLNSAGLLDFVRSQIRQAPGAP